MEPELIISGNQIDYDLAELLGETPGDFLVLCFDGVQFNRFGTPYDTPVQRARKQEMVNYLNDRSKHSWWTEMWKNWAGEIRQQFNLPAETGADDYRPVVSYKIKRVVAGRSQYLHCAIRLFEELDDRIETWGVRKCNDGKYLVNIVSADRSICIHSDESLPLAICQAVVRLLTSNAKNP